MKWLTKLFHRKPDYIVVDCAHACLKEKCPKWVVMYHHITTHDGKQETKQEGKCAMAWIPTLLIELKESLRTK